MVMQSILREVRKTAALLFVISFVSAAAPAPKALVIPTVDGVVLQAVWFETEKPAKVGWLLLHGLGSVKEEWTPLVSKLVAAGQAVCLVDLRGHGKSTQRLDGSGISYQQFREIGPKSQWSKMIADVDPVLDQFAKASGLPRERIGIGGASLGANIALNAAAADRRIPALILLSPGLEYAGIRSVGVFEQLQRRPVFMAASPGDGYAFSSVQQLARHRQDPALRLKVGDGAAHGVQMFSETFMAELAGWARDTLSPKPKK